MHIFHLKKIVSIGMSKIALILIITFVICIAILVTFFVTRPRGGEVDSRANTPQRYLLTEEEKVLILKDMQKQSVTTLSPKQKQTILLEMTSSQNTNKIPQLSDEQKEKLLQQLAN